MVLEGYDKDRHQRMKFCFDFDVDINDWSRYCRLQGYAMDRYSMEWWMVLSADTIDLEESVVYRA